jgi:hypothetical protein
MQNSSKTLFRSHQKKQKLKRIVRDLSRFFYRPQSSRTDGGKAGPFLPHKGITMLPEGYIVPEYFRSAHEADLLSGDFEIETAQESYLDGEWTEMDRNCREMLKAIDEGRWDDCEEYMDLMYGRIEDMPIGERGTRRSYDDLFDEFREALEFLQSVEFSPLWIPTTPEILTAEEFVFVDRKIAEQIAKQPSLIFSVNPRFFEELIASIYGDLGYQVLLTKRTSDGGRDIICLAHKDGMNTKLIIECKRYAARKKISVSQVRSLYGVAQDERVTHAILATTSSFTEPALKFASPHIWQMSLLDYDDLMRMIRKYALGHAR